jgi:hypothetical protein
MSATTASPETEQLPKSKPWIESTDLYEDESPGNFLVPRSKQKIQARIANAQNDQ